MYGLPKIHKTGIPLRPIMSMVGSAQHRLAKYLVKVLKPVDDFYSTHVIKDSLDLSSTLKRMKFSSTDNITLASLDIVSLFTNVPVIDCLNVIDDAITNHGVDVNFDKQLLLKVLKMCVLNVDFLFDGKYYTQTDGVAIGSPLDPILADIFVGYIERQVNIVNKSDGS